MWGDPTAPPELTRRRNLASRDLALRSALAMLGTRSARAPLPAPGGSCAGCADSSSGSLTPTVYDPTPDIPGYVVYTESPLCDGAWGSVLLQVLAVLQADEYCRTGCPSGTGRLCDDAYWDPDTCVLHVQCCDCLVAPPLGGPPNDPPYPPHVGGVGRPA